MGVVEDGVKSRTCKEEERKGCVKERWTLAVAPLQRRAGGKGKVSEIKSHSQSHYQALRPLIEVVMVPEFLTLKQHRPPSPLSLILCYYCHHIVHTAKTKERSGRGRKTQYLLTVWHVVWYVPMCPGTKRTTLARKNKWTTPSIGSASFHSLWLVQLLIGLKTTLFWTTDDRTTRVLISKR